MATLAGKPSASPLFDMALTQSPLTAFGTTNFPSLGSSGGSSSSASGSSTSNPILMPILDDPRLGGLFAQNQAAIPTDLASLSQFIGMGMNSPLLQQILGPALARLMGTEQVSRDAVTDAARAAGSLRSTAYGQSFARNEQNIMQNRANLLSDTIAKTLSTLVPGLLQEQQNQFLPAKAMTDLLQASRPIPGDVRSSIESRSSAGGGGGSAGGLTGFGDIRDNPYSGFYRGDAFVRPGHDFSRTGAPTVPSPYYDPFGGGGGGGEPLITGPSGLGGWTPPQHTYGPWETISSPAPSQPQWGLGVESVQYGPQNEWDWGNIPFYEGEY